MKKLPTLHILNGDASVPAFERANLPGQVVVWREILSEGPVPAALPEQAFWQARQNYITSAFGESDVKYKEKVLDVVQKLESASNSFFEVILWFDADLMCQVNLLYLLHYLSSKKVRILSVCTPAPKMNIGHLQPSALQQLMENRQLIQPEERQQARTLWQLYTSPDPLALQAYLNQQTIALPYLKQALQLHLKRFPYCSDGLSEPERALLQFVQAGLTSEEELMQAFWKQDPGYGYGDSQLKQLLSHLQPDLIQQTDPLKLSFMGDRVLQEQAFFQAKSYWLGGVEVNKKLKFCFSSEKNSLVLSS